MNTPRHDTSGEPDRRGEGAAGTDRRRPPARPEDGDLRPDEKLVPPFAPMEALQVPEIPVGPAWQYEPKWDGFRCVAFRDGEHVELQSKAGKPLTRYFPDIAKALAELAPERFVLDGELVIPVDGKLSFEELLLRIHPAEKRVRKLAAEHPAIYIVFDLLEDAGGRVLVGRPLAERRQRLEEFARRTLEENPSFRLSPATRNIETARRWFAEFGGGMDGVIAKRVDRDYRSGERTGMQKIKRLRTADCVVGGFRYASKGHGVGSLLLGLYDEDGVLNHVGFTSAIKQSERGALTKKLEALITPPGFTGRSPGGPSRWSTRRSDEWQPLRPELVVEVQYDYFSEGRFRHGTGFVRWRPDKDPRQCTMDQLFQGRRPALELTAGGD